MNIFIFIIWSTGYDKKTEILNDISDKFTVHKIMEIEWSKDLFASNISRFYEKNISEIGFKIKACGNAPFTLVVVEDDNPVFENRMTSRGDLEYVNANMFDKKALYRKWTSENKNVHSRIHGTNSVQETEHDLMMLLGLTPEEVVKNKETIPDYYKRDLVGANGWDTLEKFFKALNSTVNYVVMRNYEGLPEASYVESHEDIDILTEDLNKIVKISNGMCVFKEKYRVQYLVKISNELVQFDFRSISDGYYDNKWEKNIIDNRVMKSGIYIPCDEDYKYMILYHALIHKGKIADDYMLKLNELYGEGKWNREVLTEYMNEKGYIYSEPVDLSVYYNHLKKEKITFRRRLREMRAKTGKKVRDMLGVLN